MDTEEGLKEVKSSVNQTNMKLSHEFPLTLKASPITQLETTTLGALLTPRGQIWNNHYKFRNSEVKSKGKFNRFLKIVKLSDGSPWGFRFFFFAET